MTLVAIHKPFDMNKIREFYDPHPDFDYAALGVSEAVKGMIAEVKKLADELNGQKMSVQEATNKFEAAGTLVNVYLNEHIFHADKLPDTYDCIGMQIWGDDGYNISCIVCLIKFR